MSNRIKIASAGVGAAAVVAMGALGVALTVEGDGAATVSVVSDEMTLGETVTETTAPPEPETTLAEPTATAEPPDGFGPDWAG
jgi:hypothetical protein